LRERLREITDRKRGNHPVTEVVEEMNRVLRGWGQYFHYGNPQQSMARLNYFAAQRLRKWLMRRRQRRGPGYSRYPTGMLYGPLGLYQLPTARPGATAHAS
jgi:hypothetical protein